MKNQKLVALVTGASSGIGEATALRLLAAGYRVYGTSRQGRQAAERPYPMLALDVTDDHSVISAVDELLRLEGQIDLLVNNAGFGVAPAAAEESSITQAQQIFDTNFHGIVRMIPRRRACDATPRQWSYYQYWFNPWFNRNALCGALFSQ
ncbi:MAG: SDR family NAD(P)-dependent oxidoreductase [Rheinheimera sp.]|nr:SDR family NAD(P)-dependent oxidoreductase [Rheinheimera sp.]